VNAKAVNAATATLHWKRERSAPHPIALRISRVARDLRFSVLRALLTVLTVPAGTP
jgi:hypothetical protein